MANWGNFLLRNLKTSSVRRFRNINNFFLNPAQKSKFVFYGCLLVVILISHIWTAWLFLLLGHHYATHVLLSDLTFSLVHGTSFAFAIALFSTLLTENPVVFTRLTTKVLSLLTLAGFLAIGASLAFQDLVRPKNLLNPYQMRDPHKAITDELALRQDFASGKVCDYEASVNSFKEELRFQSIRELRQKVNCLAYYASFLTFFFVAFISVVAWYIVCPLAVLFKRRQAQTTLAQNQILVPNQPPLPPLRLIQDQFNIKSERILLIMFLLWTWFPFRIYSTWNQYDYLLKPLTDYPTIIIVAAAFLTFFFIVLFWIKGPDILALVPIVAFGLAFVVYITNTGVTGAEFVRSSIDTEIGYYAFFYLLLWVFSLLWSVCSD